MENQGTSFNHVGLCVSDRDRSRAFYENVLQFEFWWELDPPDDSVSPLLQLPRPVGLHATYLVRDGFVLELLDYSALELRPWRARSMAEPGLTHMSFSVADLALAMDRTKEFGGAVIEDTVSASAVMVKDPDGQVIELLDASWRAQLPPMPGATTR